jgi:hypothetical protein
MLNNGFSNHFPCGILFKDSRPVTGVLPQLKHFLKLADFDPEELDTVLALAGRLMLDQHTESSRGGIVGGGIMFDIPCAMEVFCD